MMRETIGSGNCSSELIPMFVSLIENSLFVYLSVLFLIIDKFF